MRVFRSHLLLHLFYRGLSLTALGATLTLTACGGCDGENNATSPGEDMGMATELPDPRNAMARPAAPLQLASETSCLIDADCKAGLYCFQNACAYECTQDAECRSGESCSPRGECQVGQQPEALEVVVRRQGLAPAAASELAGFAVTSPPQTVWDIVPGQGEITIELELNKVAPSSGVAYRLVRSDDKQSGARVQRMAGGSEKLSLTLPTGLANPRSETPSQVRIDLISAVGSFTFVLNPTPAASGVYGGNVMIDTFGSTGLPIELELVTEPSGATLQNASNAWLRLPISEYAIFSPGRAEDLPDFAVSKLTYDDFTKRWVATFDGRFDMTDGAAITASSAEQVRRQLRIELELDAQGQLIGDLRDSFKGIYEARSMDGVISLADVNFRGSFALKRLTDAPSHTEIDRNFTLPAANTKPLPAPALDLCIPSHFEIAAVDIEAESYSCAGISSAQDFALASDEEMARCAIAVSHTALSGDTTSKQIAAFLDDSVENPGGLSFAEFMADCAAGTNDTCRPSSEVSCARQLSAFAYREQQGASSYNDALLNDYLATTRESFLGRQFGAYQSDVETRLTWLSSSNYPAIATNAVKSLSESLLDTWQADVLDAHFAVLEGQFDTAGLIALSREPSSAGAIEAREALLLDMSQSFQSGMESLALAAQRWDTLYAEASKRESRAKYVTQRARDLYIAAGILKNLNLSAGTGFLSAGFGSGFANLTRQLRQLALPFNELLYARDAEVTVSTSVDPTVSNETLLRDLRTEAEKEIVEAALAVNKVLEEDKVQTLTEAQLRNKLFIEIDDLYGDLIELCGLPGGCEIADVGTRPECTPDIRYGYCGFVFDATTKEFSPEANLGNTSQAGIALLAMMEAAQGVVIAHDDVETLRANLELQHEELAAFKSNVEAWNSSRLQNIASLKAAHGQLKAIDDDELKMLAENLDERAETRRLQVEGDQEGINLWNQMRIDGANVDLGLLIGGTVARRSASTLRETAEAAKATAESAAEGLPKGLDDYTAPGRALIRLSGAAFQAISFVAATGLDVVADGLEIARERHEKMLDAQLTNLEMQSAQDDLVADVEIERLEAVADQLATKNEADRQRVLRYLELVTEQREVEMAYQRDLQELSDRRLELRMNLNELTGMELRAAQAELQLAMRERDVLFITQQAQLVNSKLVVLEEQREHINRLLGSPAAVFGRANKIVQAERRLERAKDKLMDWLVALEYYAVRPFMDQRIQILLARNTYQLEEIAEEMVRLQSKCGGAVNMNTSELSLKTDLLGITQASLDAIDGVTLSAEDRFRTYLEQGFVPIDKRVRYTTDSNIGDLLAKGSGLLTASFRVDLDDFANLGATCNAKVVSVDVQLVGEVGEGQPTVSLLYDGTSKLRSCQPGIDAYVAQFGENTTSFGALTYLKSQGRSISPVAGINVFPSNTNTTLAGLPLATQYTLLIDPTQGENGKLDWSKLTDVRLRVTYSYQDVFAQGQCE